MKKEEVRATVSSCVPSETVIRGTVSPCFEITVEFRTSKGIKSHTFKRGTAIDVGTTINMCYDHRYETVELSNGATTKVKNVPVILGSIFTVALIAASIVIAAVVSGFNDKIIGCFIGLLMCLAMMWGGICIAFVYPKHHRNVNDCILVEGRIIGHKQTAFGMLWKSQFSAIYEYIYGGKRCKVGSVNSQHRKKKIGTRVTIAVNEKTGEAFCVEETNGYYWVGGFMILIALFIIILLIREFFIPM